MPRGGSGRRGKSCTKTSSDPENREEYPSGRLLSCENEDTEYSFKRGHGSDRGRGRGRGRGQGRTRSGRGYRGSSNGDDCAYTLGSTSDDLDSSSDAPSVSSQRRGRNGKSTDRPETAPPRTTTPTRGRGRPRKYPPYSKGLEQTNELCSDSSASRRELMKINNDIMKQDSIGSSSLDLVQDLTISERAVYTLGSTSDYLDCSSDAPSVSSPRHGRRGKSMDRPETAPPRTTTPKRGRGRPRKYSSHGKGQEQTDEPCSDSSAPSKELKKICDDKVKISKSESGDTTKLVEPLVTMVLNHAKKHDNFCKMKNLNSGSHFEKLKVGRADEIDIMFCLGGIPGKYEKVTDPPSCRCFMSVRIEDRSSRWAQYCTDDGYLSPRLLRNDFEKIVEKAVKEYRPTGINITIEDSGSDACPATKLTFTKKRSNELILDVDFVIAIEVDRHNWREGYSQWNLSLWFSREEEEELKRQPFHLVAKAPPEGIGLDVDAKNMWRISYSLLEKKILYTADSRGRQLQDAAEDVSNKTCRKLCLRLLKLLRQNLKIKSRMAQRYYESFPSYFLKTALLNICLAKYRSEDWTKDLLYDRLVELLEYVVDCIKRRDLRHFFLRDLNLMDGLHQVTCNALEQHYTRALKLLQEKKFSEIF
ncbi:cyclic GMP-AMP synthase-like receptor 1 [Ptychodera flava]|uniref:cyclic GMP-AMP synthase-like receptor 1 n=1 Tax=Ptychodera flava TaxID=63121 RepID=UPI00396A3779